MIVCVCNRLNEQACRLAVLSGACRSGDDVHCCLGKRPRCGRCLPQMRALFSALARESGHAELSPMTAEAPAGGMVAAA